ncbi:A-kinase anchor protein 9 [Echinococcus multilocularis]|uniref:A-kinase anchor protein 9 n=1 Tax=Echinococcus multilocularis TaxID=6211 RepID=A0A0S4MQA6_ECHMU|nr:A-kinase anchor protein 9 [Echinococcus multilocularis]
MKLLEFCKVRRGVVWCGAMILAFVTLQVERSRRQCQRMKSVDTCMETLAKFKVRFLAHWRLLMQSAEFTG